VVRDQDVGEVLRNVSHGRGSHLSFIRYVDMDSSDFSQMYRKSKSNSDSENLDPHTPRGGSFMYLFSDRSSSTGAIAGCPLSRAFTSPEGDSYLCSPNLSQKVRFISR
jgi:hypothetical protein